jgi:exo-beta-1,3-glucanase (GH17 family)
MLKLPRGNAICYSGYRHGQSPVEKIYPTVAQIREDLHILQRNWQLLRLYDCSLHAERVLEVIRRDRLYCKVMLGAHLAAEMNNFGCPWGVSCSEAQLEANLAENDAEVERLITLERHHDDIVFSVAVGNEATVDWTDRLVAVERLIELVRRVKREVPQPVTFCENYVPWHDKLRPLARELDFISLHTYPVWEYKHVHDALHYSMDNFHGVASLYPGTPAVISEAGWATNSNGRGICPQKTSEELQAIYYRDLMEWTGREPKQVMRSLYPHLLRQRHAGQGECDLAEKPYTPLD